MDPSLDIKTLAGSADFFTPHTKTAPNVFEGRARHMNYAPLLLQFSILASVEQRNRPNVEDSAECIRLAFNKSMLRIGKDPDAIWKYKISQRLFRFKICSKQFLGEALDFVRYDGQLHPTIGVICVGQPCWEVHPDGKLLS
ncbi:hypothetical protein FSARC_13366 [Fusarium sarcochroum]|uniref:Uncharacterized protein n=1 Tax=Fusarium sarcochroum TaxID=1208366 RepID=A0A8H4WU31_9HYPO|nr:hypothetical protein FSARC_13366 [Fusarium sarcochroum]